MRGALPREPIPPPLMGGGQGEGELKTLPSPPPLALPREGGELDKGYIYR